MRQVRWQIGTLSGWWLMALVISLTLIGWPEPVAANDACPPSVICPAKVSSGARANALPVAAGSGITLSVEAGIGGYARTGSWLPLYLNLENKGPKISGELAISLTAGPSVPNPNNSSTSNSNPNYIPGSSNGSYQYGARQLELYTSLYVQPLDLANGARKQLTMYIPLTTYELFSQKVQVELEGSQGGEQQLLASAEAPVKSLLNQALVGLLSPTPELFQSFDNILIGQPGGNNSNQTQKTGPMIHLALAQLDAARLPAIGQALGSMNALLVHDFDLTTLSPQQGVSLESWVRGGGSLIISGGAGGLRSLKSLPQALLPVNLPGPQDLLPLGNADRASLENMGGAALADNNAGVSYLLNLKPVPDSRVILKGDQTPLIVGMRRGSGSVVTTAFDLVERRFTNWDGSSMLWSNLLGSSIWNEASQGHIYSNYGLSNNLLNGGVTSILTNIPGVTIPSLKIVGLLALLYILVVGPVNYLVLKRLGRRELSWLTLPTLTIVFAVGIYVFALRDKGTDIITSSVNIVRLDSRDTVSGPFDKSALGMVGVFAPNNNSYRLELPPNSLVSAVPSYLPNPLQSLPVGSNGQLPTPRPQPNYQPPVGLRIIQGDTPQVDLLGMSQWSFRSVLVEGTVHLAGTLSADLVQSNGRIQGTVTNHTGQTLEDVTVISNFGFFKLPTDLANQASAPVDFPNVFGQPSNIASTFKGVSYNTYPNSQINMSANDHTEARKRDLLTLMYNSLPSSSVPGYAGPSAVPVTYQVALVGWLEKPVLQYKVNGRQVGGNDLTMFVSEALLDPARSTELLPGLVRGSVIDKQEVLSTAPLASANQPTNGPPRPSVLPGGASLEVGQLTVEYSLSSLAGRVPNRLVLESPGYLYRKNTYGVQPVPRYSVSLYNYKTGKWDVVPVILAPAACLDVISAYQGGPVTAPISSFNLNAVSGQVSPACQAAVRGIGSGLSPTVTQPPSTPLTPLTPTLGQPTVTPGNSATAGLRLTMTAFAGATPVPILNYANGPADNFVVLESGPNFNLAAYFSPDDKLQVRYSRDTASSDIMYWYYFTIGYRLKS